MARTRIKICGITRPEDALAAAAAGVDAVGMVFYEPSPRSVTMELAAELVAVLPPFVTAVGLFVDAPEATVRATLERVPLDMLQFHGDETPHYCASFGRPWYKAVRMRRDEDVAAQARAYSGGRAILLDSYRAGMPGGTGETFDWERVPKLAMPIILAGGLDADNVESAVVRVRPAAVDVSGGVEQAPGIKDPVLISKFCAAVRAAAE